MRYTHCGRFGEDLWNQHLFRVSYFVEFAAASVALVDSYLGLIVLTLKWSSLVSFCYLSVIISIPFDADHS